MVERQSVNCQKSGATMIGPLPPRYRYTVLIVTILGCLALTAWLSPSLSAPHLGILVGLLGGAGLAYLLLHDFTRRSAP